MRIEERGAEVFQPCDGFLRRQVDGILPSLHRDAAILGVDGKAERVFAQRALQILGKFELDQFVASRRFGCPIHRGVWRWVGWFDTEEARPVDDTPGTGVEQRAAIRSGLEPTADLAGQTATDALDQRAVLALSHRRIEIDQLHQGVFCEPLNPVIKVVEGKL